MRLFNEMNSFIVETKKKKNDSLSSPGKASQNDKPAVSRNNYAPNPAVPSARRRIAARVWLLILGILSLSLSAIFFFSGLVGNSSLTITGGMMAVAGIVLLIIRSRKR